MVASTTAVRSREGILVKDNHLAGLSIHRGRWRRARQRWPGLPVEVECDTLDQVKEAVEAGAELVLVDNMSPAEVAAAVAARRRPLSRSRSPGGVTLETVAGYAAAGADLISVGALTHSAPVLDVGLDLEPAEPVLLAIDVGNTQTVIGLFAPGDGPDRSAARRAAPPLAHRDHVPTARRTRWRC